MSSVLITGADGFLGSKITHKILGETSFDVIGLTLSMDLAEGMLAREGLKDEKRIKFITNDAFLRGDHPDMDVYGAVHLAFSRRMCPAADIASSIRFASRVFHALKDMGVDRIINMSSQGVYGNTDQIRTEDTPPAPSTQYTMAKYAAEVLFDDILKDCPHHTNFRLDPVAQSQNVVIGLCKSAKEGVIHIKGGRQVFSFIDANDVPSAVLAMLISKGDWAPVYNVGWNRRRYTLLELAQMVADAAEQCGYPRPRIETESADIALWAGMDSTQFMQKTGWKPSSTMVDSLRQIMGD